MSASASTISSSDDPVTPYVDTNFYSHDERVTLPALLVKLTTYNPPFTLCVCGVLASFYRGMGAMRRSDKFLSNRMMRHRVMWQFAAFSFLVGKEYLNIVNAERDMQRRGAERLSRGELPLYLADPRLEHTVQMSRLTQSGWGGRPTPPKEVPLK